MVRRISFGVLVVLAAACAKVVVIPVPQGSGLNDEGVFYALPKTVARVHTKIDRDAKQSARFARFAAIFAPGSTPPCGTIKKCRPNDKGVMPSSTKYALQQGASFVPFGEPDPAQVFLVKFKGGGAIDQSLSMTWNEMGLMSAATASVTNRTTDIVMSGLKMAASLGVKVASGGGAPGATVKTLTQCEGRNRGHANDAWVIEILRKENFADTSNYLIANYCDLPVTDSDPQEDENSRDDFERDKDEEALKLAMAAFRVRVEPLADRRFDVLTGANLLEPVPYLAKLDELIDNELQALFIGSESKKTWELAFDVRALDPAKPVTLMRIDETQGVCVEASLLAPDAKPAPKGFDVDCAKVKGDPVQFSIAFHPDASAQLFHTVKTSTRAPSGDRSFRYVLPAQMRAAVTLKQTPYGSGVFSVAQHGHVVSLPATRNSKSLQYDLAMIEATGGLKTFKLGTTGGLDTATVDALSGVGGTLLDARNARRKAADEEAAKAEAAADELTILTRESNLLKLKDQICELQKKYGLTCTIKPE